MFDLGACGFSNVSDVVARMQLHMVEMNYQYAKLRGNTVDLDGVLRPRPKHPRLQ